MRQWLFAILVALGGCQLFSIPYGVKHPVWTKQEVVEWYGSFKEPPRFMYLGSDEQWHYFITRPIDSFVRIQIDRNELTIGEEHPCSEEMRFGYYPVDPSHEFRRIEEGKMGGGVKETSAV